MLFLNQVEAAHSVAVRLHEELVRVLRQLALLLTRRLLLLLFLEALDDLDLVNLGLLLLRKEQLHVVAAEDLLGLLALLHVLLNSLLLFLEHLIKARSVPAAHSRASTAP